MKRFFKYFGFFVLFVISIAFFSQSIPNITIGTATATSLQDSTFPLIYLQLGKYTVNTLHGYSSELDSSKVRESITPLESDKTFTIKISENESSIKKLDYELMDISNQKAIDSNTLSAFSKENSYKTARIKLNAAMDTSTEYGLKITLTTNYSKKIHFFTRIKYYDSDFYLKEKLDFVTNFHNATFDKGKSLNIRSFLETDNSDDSTLANVNIYSSYKMITWDKLKPQKITECIPTIKELNIETAAIEQTYFIKAKTDSGTEIYQITEFYRVRYTSDRIYLLYFQREMEAMFDPALTSLSQSQFKIGITNAKDLDITSNEDNDKVAFVRNGSLWYYDLKTNKLNQVFSFVQNSDDYLRDYYDQHNIRILNVDKDGNIDFIVYGYMNCGDYEGRVGILLYNYKPTENQIYERVYIPLTTTYQQLKEDFGTFSYVNKKNIFYFSLNDTVYAYNITSKQYNILTQNASSDNFAMLENARCFVWSNAKKDKPASNITILDLESEKEISVSAQKNQSIKVLGTIDSNIVYGFVRNSDIYESTDGEQIYPVYKMIIADCQGGILKTYQSKNVYIIRANVDEDIIRLKRVKKSNGTFKKMSDDSIQHQKNDFVKSFYLTTRETEKTRTEKYISLPAGYVMKGLPDTTATKYVMVTENTTLHLKENTDNISTKYYIYAYGRITSSLNNAGEAIRLADEQMGVVMDNKSHLIWERGGKFTSKTLSSINKTTVGTGVSSIKACVQMLLQAAQVTTTASQLKGASAMDMLRNHLDTPVNLTGCTVDEVLYFVSNEKPVIAMKNSSQAVLITAYDTSSVTCFDPSTGSSTKMLLSNAENYFEAAGYVFFSFI